MNTFVSQRKRLFWSLAAIFAGLAVAVGFLVFYSFAQLRFEAYFTQRQLAEDFAGGVGRELTRLMSVEDARPATDYEFLIVTGEAYVQRSPLSTLTPDSTFPGLIGYFQVDTAGRFSTPLLPSQVEEAQSVGLTNTELNKRSDAQEKIRRLLVQPKVPRSTQLRDQAASGDEASAPGGKEDKTRERNRQIFDELSEPDDISLQASYKSELGRVEEYELDTFSGPSPAQESAASAPVLRTAPTVFAKKQRKESARVVDQRISPFELTANQRITVFESTINEFAMVPLDVEHVAFHREVLINDERKIQGFVVAQAPFIRSLIGNAFEGSQLAADNDLLVAVNGEVISLTPAAGRQGYATAPADLVGTSMILSESLPPPAQLIHMIVTAEALPLGAGFQAIVLAGILSLAVLVIGFSVLNRLGRQSISLAEQQQNFVSAVSHELKTPLTSIRMYGEILRAGWADEDKKRAYYDYIFNESERLSRLVDNVLQLARISRGNQPTTATTALPVSTLVEAAQVQITGPVTRAGFTLTCNVPDESRGVSVTVDPDAFQQIALNLVDNAIKFSANGARREIEFGVRVRADRVVFYVRDYGPGIDKAQLKRIFTLFYRAESELTRETAGTGIGLALVAQLADAMGGEIDVINCEPGAEFSVSLRRQFA